MFDPVVDATQPPMCEYQLPEAPDDFRAWLQTEEAKRATMFASENVHCPLYWYMKSHGVPVSSVCSDYWFDSLSPGWHWTKEKSWHHPNRHPSPEWAMKFVHTLDAEFHNNPVSPEDCEKILDYYNDGII